MRESGPDLGAAAYGGKLGGRGRRLDKASRRLHSATRTGESCVLSLDGEESTEKYRRAKGGGRDGRAPGSRSRGDARQMGNFGGLRPAPRRGKDKTQTVRRSFADAQQDVGYYSDNIRLNSRISDIRRILGILYSIPLSKKVSGFIFDIRKILRISKNPSELLSDLLRSVSGSDIIRSVCTPR